MSNAISGTSGTSRTFEASGYDTRITPTVTAGKWNDLLARSPAATLFHRHECLRVLADHFGATLYPMVGYQADRPVGLFPVFVRSLGPVTAVFSPPPNLKIRYLGPVTIPRSGSDAEAERRRLSFVKAALTCCRDRFDPGYVHVRSAPAFGDPRAFEWRGYDLTPRFSYEVDLTPGREELLARFSSDARQNLRSEPPDIAVEVGGPAAIERIIEQVGARHREQGETYRVTPGFVTDLYEALPDGTVRPYEVRLDGVPVGGMVTVEDATTIYRWQGGAKPDVGVDAPVNDLLDWEIMSRATDRGIVRYDLVGADNERIADYKAKFGPDLVTCQSMTKSTLPMRLLARLYRWYR